MLLNTIFELFLLIVAYILTLQFVLFFICSIFHFNNENKKQNEINKNHLVSILIPCYNEEMVLKNCIDSVIDQKYPNYEILILDDGSTDNTLKIATLYEKLNSNVHVYTKQNGGKASALNVGIDKCIGDIVVSLDADSIFLKDTLIKLIAPFNNDEIAAVCGNIKISNRNKLLNKLQSLEYISGLNIQRRTFAHLNCVSVISGAIGAFRKDKLIEIGKYSHDTIVEDMDITVTLAKLGYKIEYIGNAIAYTEAPESIKEFYNQRYRWSYGCIEVLSKHSNILFKGYNIGKIGLPYILASVIMNIFVTFAILYSVVKIIFYDSMTAFLPFVLMILMLQTLMFLYSVHIDDENKKLILLTPVYIVFYKQYLSIIAIYALFNFMIGKKTSWNKLKRLGKNTIVDV